MEGTPAQRGRNCHPPKMSMGIGPTLLLMTQENVIKQKFIDW